MPTKKRSLFKRLSLRSRLVLAAVVWLTAMIIAAAVTVPTQIFRYMVDDTKTQLSIHLDDIAASIEADENGKLALSTALSDPRFEQPYSGLYWSATTSSDSLRSRSLWDKDFQISKKGKLIQGARDEVLITVETTLYYPDFEGPIEVIIGIDEQPIEDIVSQLMGQIGIILLLLYFGILTVIILQVEWSLSPLTKMHKELSELRNGDKTALEKEYPKEVAPMVNDLNALLFHYQELLDRARQHAGNLSHALKTPLSVLKNEIATLDEPTQKQLQPPVNQIQDYIDYHLGRARMAGSKNILAVKANPSERVDAISMAFDKVYAAQEVVLVNEIGSDIEVAVDKTDLDEMIGNLLENAYKWSHSIIRVYAHQEESDRDIVTIIIEDDGPGIPDEQCATAIKRGVRLDESTPGTGLGLNIVSEMAHSYRGELLLARSSMGGLKAALKLNHAQNK